MLANEDVPDWAIEKIAKILIENRQEIKEAIKLVSEETGNDFDPTNIYPLLNLFEKPEDNSDIPIHQGALNYYDRNNPSFIQENSDYLALLLTLVLLVGSWLLRIKAWRDRRIESEANDKADKYIEHVVGLMQLNTQNQEPNITVSELTQSLKDLFGRQKELNNKFGEASQSVEKEEISQSGFRAFSEAYKSAREAIEQAIEDQQRQIVSVYIKDLKQLLKELEPGKKPNKNNLLTRLDEIRNEAADNLLEDQNFSRQSFRTFVDTYNFVRDAIERYCNS